MIPTELKDKLEQYIIKVLEIYGSHLTQILLYGSYARGDYNCNSDVDIMILLDINDVELKQYRKRLSYMTCDFNLDNDLDISPYAKSQEHFYERVDAYPFYNNVINAGVLLYGVA